jgi:hypothetical protein
MSGGARASSASMARRLCLISSQRDWAVVCGLTAVNNPTDLWITGACTCCCWYCCWMGRREEFEPTLPTDSFSAHDCVLKTWIQTILPKQNCWQNFTSRIIIERTSCKIFPARWWLVMDFLLFLQFFSSSWLNDEYWSKDMCLFSTRLYYLGFWNYRPRPSYAWPKTRGFCPSQ